MAHVRAGQAANSQRLNVWLSLHHAWPMTLVPKTTCVTTHMAEEVKRKTEHWVVLLQERT